MSQYLMLARELNNKYVKKTGKQWQNATIQDIYNAELVRDVLT